MKGLKISHIISAVLVIALLTTLTITGNNAEKSCIELGNTAEQCKVLNLD